MVHCASMQNSVWPQQHNTRFVLILLHINNLKAIFIIRYALIMTTIVYKYTIDIKGHMLWIQQYCGIIL